MLQRLVILVACLTLAACARTSQVTTRFMGAMPATPPSHLLLVARMPERDQRQRWEQACLTRFHKRERAAVTASSDALPGWYEGGNDQLLNWAGNRSPDSAVLIFELTDLLLAPFSMPPGNVVSSERFRQEDPLGEPTWRINLGGAEDIPADLQEVHETEVRLITGAGDVLWEGVVQTREANELAAIARSQCSAVLDRLSELGYLADQKTLLPFTSGR